MVAMPKLFNRPVAVQKNELWQSVGGWFAYVVSAVCHAATTVATTAGAKTNQAKKQAKRRAAQFKTYRKNAWVAGVVILAIAMPQLALLWRPVVGVYVTAASLVALFALALAFRKAQKLAISVAILPTTMLVALSLPHMDAFSRSAVFYDTALLLALFYGYVFTIDEPRSALSLGKKYMVLLPLMIVVGQALGSLGFGMLRGDYPYGNIPLQLVAATAVVFAIAEELVFRGLIQHQAAKVVHPVAAAFISVFAYTIVLTTHGSVLPALFALVSGTALSVTYYFKQNLVLTTVLNAAIKLTYVGLMAVFVLR